ncbi:extracellular solute-binding protein [Falsiroseomonas tokyonensis]|uniref:Extracellular solute-binding protein n=1 Tax=Falsiroseomonas tokyonensis TaxID=430521 RepID=A0ABV7C048_9PROT|nr:extracellular solute-binding protein [Falsiroseomonas tokyonensis]MBU8540472.1 extracellular solute-binding protein [Falsiroseomonas tokyonensis]
MRGRRHWLRGLAALPLSAALPARAQGPRDLTVVSWGGAYQDAQRDIFFRPWMTAREARLLEETWYGGMDVLRERIRAGTNNWDLVQVEGHQLLIGCREELFEPMDWDAIGGRDAYQPAAVQDCGVGAIIYSVVLAWDRATLRGTPAGWADFFDTERFPGRRALRRRPRTTLEIALLGDGVAPAEIYALLATRAGQDRAFRKLDSIRAQLAWWDRGSQPVQWLASGEVVLTCAHNGRIAAANATDGRDFGIAWAQNLAAMDSWVILRGSPNRQRALDFLRFAGQPSVQAALPRRIPYGVTAKGAMAELPVPLLAQLPTAPAHAEKALRLDEAFWLRHLDPLNRRFEDWLRG